jgi:hypothetical protein
MLPPLQEPLEHSQPSLQAAPLGLTLYQRAVTQAWFSAYQHTGLQETATHFPPEHVCAPLQSELDVQHPDFFTQA